MNDETIYCSECGEELQANSAYCSNCGARIVVESQEQTISESTDEEPKSIPDYSKSGGIFLSGVLAILPALGAEILVLFLITSARGLVFLLTLIGFAYTFYQADTRLNMVGQMSFWLGIELLLVPLVLFAFAVRSNETVIVSMVWIVASAVVCIPLAGVLYLISRRWTG